ncbi:hypothetical protein HID58_059296 [Brassica napus]|uniref:Uncharacterized protein n=1 Tax=Brassica napus TaxID=3708 RepID=A0ABQ7ZSH0_BRANA|nr:hypothetical protein HID58_059296 [Brassica napus]
MQFLIIHSVSSLNLTNEYLNHKCCRGDSYGSKCRTCIDIAVAGCCKTLSLCKKRKDYMNQNSD